MRLDQPAAAGPGRLTGSCPFAVDRPVMRQRWQQLTFLHWRLDAAEVQRLLPAGLTVETFDGSAWVGLVPFFMRVATAADRAVPWVSSFCETNVRTYVRDAAGRSGVWFFALDAARLGAVCVARSTYRLPYFWSAMSLTRSGAEVRYECRRRWPGPGARSLVRVSVGEPYQPDDLTQLDHFLTARWILFAAPRGGHRIARACHPPWPLVRARAQLVDDQLIEAAGLPPVPDEPLVHYAAGVDVAISRPERAAR